MEDRYTFLFKLKIWNPDKADGEVRYCVINDSSLHLATKQLWDYYGDELLDFHCDILEEKLIFLNEELYNVMKES